MKDLGNNYDKVFCCIGNNKLCGELVEKAKKMGMNVAVMLHPSTYISQEHLLGQKQSS